jgi:hypothetical protein
MWLIDIASIVHGKHSCRWAVRYETAGAGSSTVTYVCVVFLKAIMRKKMRTVAIMRTTNVRVLLQFSHVCMIPKAYAAVQSLLYML